MRRRGRKNRLLTGFVGLAALVLASGCGGDSSSDPAPVSREDVIAERFATSLHGTRQGKDTWYNDTDGFGTVVDVAYANLPCVDCHDKSDNGPWDGDPTDDVFVDTWTGEPNCLDCHEQEAGDAVSDDRCLGCHGRQRTEMSLGMTDVHRDGSSAMGCMDCHSDGDVHGDGTAYTTMFEPGAIDAKCQDCHTEAQLAGLNDFHDTTHMGSIDCSTCHMQSAIACYNCHFDNEGLNDGTVTHAKFASAKFGGPGEKAWRFLVNRVIDDQGNTKIYPGSMQSLMADVTAANDGANDGLGATFVAIGPYFSHSIQRNAITCEACHASAALQQYVDEGQIDVVKWQGDTGVQVPVSQMGTNWLPPRGVIPIPPDAATALNFDFVDLVDPAAGLTPTGTSSSDRVLFKRGADVIHFVDEYVTPLTAAQISRLGWFATSLHGTRNGKETFYNDGMGEANPAALGLGFGNFVDVAYTDLPCADCHNGSDDGRWDADAGPTVDDTWPGNPVCRDCHTSASPANPTVSKDTCKECHGRLGAEASLGLNDVHAAFECTQCHALADIHGTGVELITMFDGAITADCETCHAGMAASTTLEHQEHLDNLDCSTCHMESVVTCYNCHFDNEGLNDDSVNHAKFASAKFGGGPASGKAWRFLVNRVLPDGSTKVYPGSMQSLMADVTAAGDGLDDGQGATFVAIAPYYAHAITRTDALVCQDCHGTQTASDLAAGTPVDVVKWTAGAGVPVPVSQMGATWQGPSGVIPVPTDTSLLLFDFVDLIDPAAPLTPTKTSSSDRVLFKNGADAIHMPAEYVRPLDTDQMDAVGFIHNETLDCAVCHPLN